MISFGRELCGNLESVVKKEWLETNGLGGFASSTIAGLNTRRYHGLLVAATKPPVGRIVMLSKIEETLIIDGRLFELGANKYPGTVHPQGFVFLREFRLDPFPVFVYEVEGVELEKRVFMVHGENTTVVEYELRRPDPEDRRGCLLELRPLIAFRDYHATTHENGALDPRVKTGPGRAVVQPYRDLPPLHVAHDADEVRETGNWYNRFEYDVERERGLDFQEDLFQPLVLSIDLSRRSSATVIASTEEHHIRDSTRLRRAEIERRSQIVDNSPVDQPFVRAMVTAADQFIVQRGNLQTVIAGYHWFGDWGRDTMISLPGLLLVTGRYDIARSVLQAFAEHTDQGMLPNRFPDQGETPEYNTVDATLWFFEAIRSYLQYARDLKFVQSLYPVLQDIIDWHVRGTRYGIRVDEDGLLLSGEPGAQLTWMDAKVDEWVVTPRWGKPVEIQALWYNALRIMEDLALRCADVSGAEKYRAMALKAEREFPGLFWNEAAGCLYDCVTGNARDASIRPNQVFAVSLPYTMLGQDQAQQVVSVVERELLTPWGLRTLARNDTQYRPRYEGDRWSRDGAYHQGTVWPWLLGPFITAYRKVHPGSESRRQAEQWLSVFQQHLCDAGLGQASEIFDAEPPHRPRGCIAQAWSVAELLRTAVEDVYFTSGANGE